MRSLRCSFLVLLLFLNVAFIVSLGCQTATPPTSDVSPVIKTAPDSETSVTFLAVGDMMLSRGVAQATLRANDPLLPFRQLAELFRSTDFNFGNLECPISGNDRVLGRGLIFNAHTRDTAGLTEYNFKVVNLANNHALDQRLPGLQYTQQYLRDKGITYLGVGDNLEQAWQPKVITIKNLKIGFIGASYASINDGGVARNNYVARIEDVENLQKAIARAKAEADFIVVTMHAGTEYVASPDPRRALDKAQIAFAHAAIDYGADLVIGAHPHWIQNMERYSGKYIFYSLGNFIFDQRQPLTNEGLVLKITLTGKRGPFSPIFSLETKRRNGFATRVEQIESIPVMIENRSTPRLASEAETARILKRLNLPQRVVGEDVATAK